MSRKFSATVMITTEKEKKKRVFVDQSLHKIYFSKYYYGIFSYFFISHKFLLTSNSLTRYEFSSQMHHVKFNGSPFGTWRSKVALGRPYTFCRNYNRGFTLPIYLKVKKYTKIMHSVSRFWSYTKRWAITTSRWFYQLQVIILWKIWKIPGLLACDKEHHL